MADDVMSEPVSAWHFVGDTLRDGRPIPRDGEWLEHDGPVALCESGLHASEDVWDALGYAPGATLCRVEVDGTIVRSDDKLVASRRRIVQRIDATDLLRAFARQCAIDVIHLWDTPDVARRYLETGDETIRAASWYAARDAAWYAARYAAWYAASAAARYAARDAAWYAARAAQATRFRAMVDEAFTAVPQ